MLSIADSLHLDDAVGTPLDCPDQDLLAQVAQGDLRAVGALYDRHAPVLLSVSLRIVRQRAEAEDVLHDAFVTMRERAVHYAPERGSVLSWLVILVRNLAVDRTRRSTRRHALLRRTGPDREPRPDAETLLVGATSGALVQRALATLSEVQRQTLEVAFFEGLSYPEIAAREGVPLGTIKSRASRALAALRTALTTDPPLVGAVVESCVV